MILFLEPVSRNIGMYVPAYPLPLLEIASFVKEKLDEIDIKVISIPMDYGLPLTSKGKQKLYEKLLGDISNLKPSGIGISCTAIAQAEETINLCAMIKERYPDIFLFLGGYFPTLYYEDIFEKTDAVDLIVKGEGEIPSLEIIRRLERCEDPRDKNIPGLIWKSGNRLVITKKSERFDLAKKAVLNFGLLNHPKAYDVMPYNFSRGCPYKCNFCMEDYIRPMRKAVPVETVKMDLKNLSTYCGAQDIVVCDALFKSFELIPAIRKLGMKIHFETRCDVMDPSLIPEIADVCGTLVLGFESASYNTLRRMSKVRDRDHYNRYLANTQAIFKEAIKREIPVMIFMIAGYPGDTEQDLIDSLEFAEKLSLNKGNGGHIFKIGECHVYPKTKIHDLAVSLPDVLFDDDSVFGQNVVRKPSKDLDFNTILSYTDKIYRLSNNTPKLQKGFLKMVPFFRLPVSALQDEIIPDDCYLDEERDILKVDGENLNALRELLGVLRKKNEGELSAERKRRILQI